MAYRFNWPYPAIALLHQLWQERDKISIQEMATRISREFNRDVTALGVAKKAAREGLPNCRSGRPRAKEANTRAEILVGLRAFISAEIDAGAAREDIIVAALAKFAAPRHRITTIWRQEKEKRGYEAIVGFTPPPEMARLQLAPGIFAADPKSYELIQRARAE